MSHTIQISSHPEWENMDTTMESNIDRLIEHQYHKYEYI